MTLTRDTSPLYKTFYHALLRAEYVGTKQEEKEYDGWNYNEASYNNA